MWKGDGRDLIKAMSGQRIRNFLADAGVVPSKQLGQNFLIDPEISKWIVDRLEAGADDCVVEAGPGTGALTDFYVGRVRKVVLIEFDAKLAAALRAKFAGRGDVVVHHADAATFDRRLLFKERPVRFLGNLPYSSGGAIMKNLLSAPHPFERAVIMLQKEVIERLGAGPGVKEYGILSLRMQVNWRIEPLRVIPPDAFFPKPGIDSAVAVLTPVPRKELPVFDGRLFDELVRRGFSQRRKQLGKHLPEGRAWPEVSGRLGLAPTVRGEELDLAKWIDLTREYDDHPLKDNAQREDEIFDVVDGDDRVIGQAKRREVHEKGLTHRAVHVFIFNRNGDLYLQKRSHLKDMNPGVWDSSVSGHLDSGEEYEEAALREIREEAGIRVTGSEGLEEAMILEACEETGWEHVRMFKLRHKGAVDFPASEIEAMLAFPLGEIREWLERVPEDFSPAFRKLFAGRGSVWQEGAEHSQDDACGDIK